eukprot:9086486-Pyramimonas_sp.AAC.1
MVQRDVRFPEVLGHHVGIVINDASSPSIPNRPAWQLRGQLRVVAARLDVGPIVRFTAHWLRQIRNGEYSVLRK